MLHIQLSVRNGARPFRLLLPSIMLLVLASTAVAQDFPMPSRGPQTAADYAQAWEELLSPATQEEFHGIALNQGMGEQFISDLDHLGRTGNWQVLDGILVLEFTRPNRLLNDFQVILCLNTMVSASLKAKNPDGLLRSETWTIALIQELNWEVRNPAKTDIENLEEELMKRHEMIKSRVFHDACWKSGDCTAEEFHSLRSVKARFLFESYRRLLDSPELAQPEGAQLHRMPNAPVIPNPATGFRHEVDPGLIADPYLREEYEQRLRRKRDDFATLRIGGSRDRYIESFARRAREYSLASFSHAPGDRPEFIALAQEYDLPPGWVEETLEMIDAALTGGTSAEP